MNNRIRQIIKSDLDSLKAVIDSKELFPADLLDEMTSDFFTNEKTQDIWLTKHIDNKPIAVVYCAPERMTSGTYNLYLIAIHKDFQGQGIGAELMAHVENLLKGNSNRILIVETSGLPEFELTRKFYAKLNYKHEATIRAFYQDGEDKIVYWKKLTE
jgi:GNAT superfamily N-acetyltransferase